MVETLDEYIRTGEAARILGVSTVTVNAWVNAGRLPCLEVASGQRIRLFKREDVERFATERQQAASTTTPAA